MMKYIYDGITQEVTILREHEKSLEVMGSTVLEYTETARMKVLIESFMPELQSMLCWRTKTEGTTPKTPKDEFDANGYVGSNRSLGSLPSEDIETDITSEGKNLVSEISLHFCNTGDSAVISGEQQDVLPSERIRAGGIGCRRTIRLGSCLGSTVKTRA